MLQMLVILRYLIVFFSVFFGFYYLTQPELALKIVTFGMVGLVGIISFVTHVPFHKKDAERLGWKTDRPDWQFEVGFANLAFGLSAIMATLCPLGTAGMVVVLIGYAVYLLQAAILHGYRTLTTKPIQTRRFLRSSLLTVVYVILMFYFAIALK